MIHKLHIPTLFIFITASCGRNPETFNSLRNEESNNKELLNKIANIKECNVQGEISNIQGIDFVFTASNLPINSSSLQTCLDKLDEKLPELNILSVTRQIPPTTRSQNINTERQEQNVSVLVTRAPLANVLVSNPSIDCIVKVISHNNSIEDKLEAIVRKSTRAQACAGQVLQTFNLVQIAELSSKTSFFVSQDTFYNRLRRLSAEQGFTVSINEPTRGHSSLLHQAPLHENNGVTYKIDLSNSSLSFESLIEKISAHIPDAQFTSLDKNLRTFTVYKGLAIGARRRNRK